MHKGLLIWNILLTVIIIALIATLSFQFRTLRIGYAEISDNLDEYSEAIDAQADILNEITETLKGMTRRRVEIDLVE